MKPLLKGTALFVAVACFVWIVVLWRWRSTQHDLNAGDIVLYLGVLPVMVFALGLAVRSAVRGALAKQDARVENSAAAAASGKRSAQASTPASKDAAPAPWHLLGAWVHTAGGASLEELLAAIEAGTPRPRPDEALHDDDGLPVMTARIEGLDTEAVESALQQLATATLAGVEGQAVNVALPRAVRALTILSPLIDELAESLLMWSQQWADAAASRPKVPAASAASSASPFASTLPLGSASPLDAVQEDKIVRVLASWPADWDDATCAAAQAWLAERLCEPLASALPLARWSIRTQRMSGCELLSAAQRTLDVLQRQGRDDPVALMACHSDLDEPGIGALESAQRLFHSTRRPKAAMAGEGAAVLVVSAVAWPADAAVDGERVRLTGPFMVRRSQSIESAGRASSNDAVGVVRLALATAGFPGTTVTKLASDTDQHTARATELFAVALALLPELDANDDFRLAGTIAGRLEAVAPLLTLACAAAQARESGKPAIALSLADPHWRMAAVLTPESFSFVPALEPEPALA